VLARGCFQSQSISLSQPFCQTEVITCCPLRPCSNAGANLCYHVVVGSSATFENPCHLQAVVSQPFPREEQPASIMAEPESEIVTLEELWMRYLVSDKFRWVEPVFSPRVRGGEPPSNLEDLWSRRVVAKDLRHIPSMGGALRAHVFYRHDHFHTYFRRLNSESEFMRWTTVCEECSFCNSGEGGPSCGEHQVTVSVEQLREIKTEGHKPNAPPHILFP
jgi:hypothetical protein